MSHKQLLSDELDLITKELKRYFSSSELEKIARETGFVKRKSKFTARDFIYLAVFSATKVSTQSLPELCGNLDANMDISMSPQGLDQRINPSGVEFLKKLFSILFQNISMANSKISSETYNLFERIRVLDSTAFQITDKHNQDYPGAGGCAHKAGVKIQLEYDLLTGNFMNIDIGPGKSNDKTYGSTLIDTVNEKDLFLRDLGYFCIDDFNRISEKGAYFVSRLKTNVCVYKLNENPEYLRNGNVKKSTLYTKLDLNQISEQLEIGETVELEDVYIGRDIKFKTRLVLYKLTKKQLEERYSKREKNEKKKGIKYTDKTKELMKLNMYISNIPKEEVLKEQMHELYSLRWQVEIIFKTWKSSFDIDEIKPVKIERFECFLYGKLITILVSSTIMFKMRALIFINQNKELSELKSISIIKEYRLLIFKNMQNLKQVLFKIYKILAKFGQKVRRCNKKTVFDILGAIFKDEINSYPNTACKIAS